MTRRDIILTAAAGLLVLGILLFLASRESSVTQSAAPVPGAGLPAPIPATAGREKLSGPVSQWPGEAVMNGYASPDSTPEEDLTRVSRLLDAIRQLRKGPEPLPLGANEEITAAVLGRGRYLDAFLPPDHPAIDSAGRMIDRWGTPLFFHAESADRTGLRSAGPDKTMWTADDVVREPGGGRH